MENTETFSHKQSSSLPKIVWASISIVVPIGVVILHFLIYYVGSPKEDHSVLYARTIMKNIETALELYNMEYKKYPTTEQGLRVLLKTNPKINKPYIVRIPEDPWGNPFYYCSDGSTYELICYGADGKKGGKEKNADIKFSPDHS